jgi:hypothetical protein
MFFHDVLNAAGGLRNLLELWPELPPDEAAEMSGSLVRLATQVVEEILAQRDLMAAERSHLRARPAPVVVRGLLTELVDLHGRHTAGVGKSLDRRCAARSATLVTDAVLLRRVPGNPPSRRSRGGAPPSR